MSNKKDALRKIYKSRPYEGIEQTCKNFERFYKESQIQPDAIFAAYMPLAHEFNIAGILEFLQKNNHRILIPITDFKTAAMTFGLYDPINMKPNKVGILEPPTPCDLMPDMMIVPGMAFDENGHRLGYGAGHYDRWFAKHKNTNKMLVVACTTENHMIPVLPSEPHDYKMDVIITNKRILKP
jgi:5-formyltetrahydrofolate cyclo-ligase